MTHRSGMLALFGLCVSLCLAGCAESVVADPTAPSGERVAAAYQQASSDFELDVLEDGEITSEEYDDAMDRFVECMDEAGVTVSLNDVGGYYTYQVSDSGGFEAHQSTCREGTVALIEPIYVDSVINPDALEPSDAIAACLVRHGVVPEGFTGDDFDEVANAPGGLADTSQTAWPDVDFNPSTNPAVDGCLVNAAA